MSNQTQQEFDDPVRVAHLGGGIELFWCGGRIVGTCDRCGKDAYFEWACYDEDDDQFLASVHRPQYCYEHAKYKIENLFTCPW